MKITVRWVLLFAVLVSSCHIDHPHTMSKSTNDSILCEIRKSLMEEQIQKIACQTDPDERSYYYLTDGVAQCIFVWKLEGEKELQVSCIYDAQGEKFIFKAPVAEIIFHQRY